MEETPKRNFCFILCNSTFGGKMNDLEGYEKDYIKIQDTFERLNFNVRKTLNKNVEVMKEELTKWSKESCTNEDEFVVIFVLSHGDKYGNIFGSNKGTITLKEIKEYFCHQSCSMREKAKLIFVQACRGDLIPEAAGPNDSASWFNDGKTLVYYSTASGYESRVDNDGSVFIQKSCDVLNSKENLKLSEFLPLANKLIGETLVANKYMHAPEVVSSLSSDLSFHNIYPHENDATQKRDYDVKQKNPCYIFTYKYNHDVVDRNSVEMVNRIFSKLNFSVKNFQDTSEYDMEGKLKEEIDTKFDCISYVFLVGGKTIGETSRHYIWCDSKKLYIDKLVQDVSDSQHKGFAEKPKLFFFLVSQKNPALPSGDGACKLQSEGENNLHPPMLNNFIINIDVEDKDKCDYVLHILDNYINSTAKVSLTDFVHQIVSNLRHNSFSPFTRNSLTYNVIFDKLESSSESIVFALSKSTTLTRQDDEHFQNQPVELSVATKEKETFQQKTLPAETVVKSFLENEDTGRVVAQSSSSAGTMLSHLKLEDILLSDINAIANILDGSHSNWNDVGDLIFCDSDDTVKLRLKQLKLRGSSPGAELIQALEDLGITFGVFSSRVNEMKAIHKTKIISILNKANPKQTDLVNLATEYMRTISLYLDDKHRWEQLYIQFEKEIDKETYLRIKRAKKGDVENTVTGDFIKLINEVKPGYTLGEFRDVLIKLNINNAAKVVEEIMRKRAEEQGVK